MITIEELQSAPCEPLSRAQVAKRLNVSEYFVKQHDEELCGVGKPRRYDAVIVDAFGRDYFRGKKIKELETAKALEEAIADLGLRTGAQTGKPRGNVRPILRAVAR